jgi:hypothetical protein
MDININKNIDGVVIVTTTDNMNEQFIIEDNSLFEASFEIIKFIQIIAKTQKVATIKLVTTIENKVVSLDVKKDIQKCYSVILDKKLSNITTKITF